MLDQESRQENCTVENRTVEKSDEEILRLVRLALGASHYTQIQNLHVYCDHGRITIQGKLPSSFLKDVAQAAIHSVADVRDIDNDVHVRSY
jgi:osmotically-inducible protein OsmY